MNIKKTFLGFGISTIIVLTLLLSANKAHAEYPNILVGQDLSTGSTGQGVVVLQGLMTELGYLNVPAGIPFGYYGSMTRDAVVRYQSSQSVSPNSGMFGGLTKVAMYNNFSSRGWVKVLGWDNSVNN